MAANSTLKACGQENVVTKNWFTRFARRHPTTVFKRSYKPLSAEKKAAHERAEIEVHLDKFQQAIKDDNHPIQRENVWNFDETGFRIGCLRGSIVSVRSTTKVVYLADSDNRESITVMEAISAAGKSSPPMIIMAGILMKEKHFDNNVQGDTLSEVSDSGYTND
jgi:hypothetical protein